MISDDAKVQEIDKSLCRIYFTGLRTNKAYTHTGTSSPPLIINSHSTALNGEYARAGDKEFAALAGGSTCTSVRLLGM